MTEKKRVLREFEWFQVQTKVRQLIGEVLQPFQQAMLSNSLALSRLEQNAECERGKVQQLTMMVNNDPGIFQHGVFGRVELKIRDCNMGIKQLQGKVEHLERFIEKKIEVLDRRLEQSAAVLGGLTEFKHYVRGELNSQNDKLVQSQQNLFGNFDKINEEISGLMLGMEGLRRQGEGMGRKIEGFQADIGAAVGRMEGEVSGFGEAVRQTRVDQELCSRDVSLLQQQIKRVGRFQRLVRQLQSHISEQSQQISNLQYKLQVVHPIVCLTQINEYAHHILPPELHNNISIYYYNRYGQLAEEIIANEVDFGKVGEARRGSLGLVKEVHKRAIKSVFRQKKERLARQGVDVDSLPHDRKEEVLRNLRLVEEFGERTDGKADGAAKSEKAEGLSEAEEAAMRERMMGELRQRIQIEMRDAKEYILRMQELMRKELDDLQLSLAELGRECGGIKMNAELSHKYFKELEGSVGVRVGGQERELERFRACLTVMKEALSAFQQIERQDERDRQAIAMVGVREHHRDQINQYRQSITSRKGRLSPVELDKKCLSCSGNANYYNEFFKMACLTYVSSPIRVDGSLLERAEFLERIQGLLSGLTGELLERREVREQKQGQLKQLQLKEVREEKEEPKMGRYESDLVVGSRDSRSAGDSYIIRNVSTSQEIRSRLDKNNDEPRIINSQELIAGLMTKNRNRLFGRRKDSSFRGSKNKNESSSKQRKEYMINVGHYFNQLRKQNESFIK